jgi:hypothetical protein
MYYIIYKGENCPVELVDQTRSRADAYYLFNNYAQAFGLLERQHRHGRDHLYLNTKPTMKDALEEI